MLQRGCDRGGKWSNISSGCASNPVDCKIRSGRLSGRRGAGIRWRRGKKRVIIIKRDFGGSYHLVRGVGRHKVKWGNVK